MDYKSMVEHTKKLTPYEEIAVQSQSVVRKTDGEMRWFEDKQEIQFEKPQFKGKNAEFSIVNRPFQKIWFSQLSSQGVTEDFNLPLLDEIILKNQTKWCIVEKFKTAYEFWEAVKGRKFIVSIKGKGFCLNKNSPIVNTLKTPVVSDRSVSVENVDKHIFEYIRNAVKYGNIKCVRGTLKYKTAYRLTEI